MTPAAEIVPSRRQLVWLVSLLFLVPCFSGLFTAFDWNHGVAKMIILAGLGAGLIALWVKPLPFRAGIEPVPDLHKTVRKVLAAFIAIYAVMAGVTLYQAMTSGAIRGDQGQNLYRADLVLLQGENPYGRGEMLDIEAYETRAPLRVAAGSETKIPAADVESVLQRYWQTQDPDLRRQLLPEPPPGNSAAATEYSLLGYKYGPVLMLMTAGFVFLFGPVAVPLCTMLALAVAFWTIGQLLRRDGAPRLVAMIAVCGALLDFQLTWNFVLQAGSDIWPLMFGLLAALFARRGIRIWPGVLLGLAVCCKLAPGLLLLPIFFLRPSWRGVGAFCLTVAAVLAPWLIWDANGFMANVILWGGSMQPDPTSWALYATPGIVTPIKAALACAAFAIGVIACREMLRASNPYFGLALLAVFVIPLGNAFHNNYLSWISLWTILAVTHWCFAQDQSQQAAR